MNNLELFNAVQAANPSKTPQEAQRATNDIWKKLKETNKGDDFACAVRDKIGELRQAATRGKSTLLNYWVQLPSIVLPFRIPDTPFYSFPTSDVFRLDFCVAFHAAPLQSMSCCRAEYSYHRDDCATS